MCSFSMLVQPPVTHGIDNAARDAKPVPDASTKIPATFDFSALPGEIRNKIYCNYLGQWDAVIEYHRKSACFKLSGVPEYGLMRVNRAMHGECHTLVPQAYSGKLVLKDAKVRRERGFGFASSLDVVASLCPPWMLQNTWMVSVDQGTTSMLVALPWYKLNSLEEVHLEGNNLPTAYHYPCGISACAKEAQEKDVLEGKYDKWCVNGYNAWSQVPKPIADGKIRVMTIRCGVVKGITLRVQVQHLADHAEVVSRCIMRPGESAIVVIASNKGTPLTCQPM